MTSESHLPLRSLEKLLEEFRAGRTEASEKLFRIYRPWLSLLARVQMENSVGGKFDASDIVQQTLLQACQAAPQFRGTTESEWLAWLRRILSHALAHEIRRYYGAQKRDIRREQSLDEELTQSSLRLANTLVATASSPAERVERREREVLLAALLDGLDPDYREVIILRNLEGLTHEEIALRMNRTAGAVRMLWARALAALKEAAESSSRDD